MFFESIPLITTVSSLNILLSIGTVPCLNSLNLCSFFWYFRLRVDIQCICLLATVTKLLQHHFGLAFYLTLTMRMTMFFVSIFLHSSGIINN